MRFGQLIESNIGIFFFKNHAENEAGRLVPDLFFNKSVSWGKRKWSAAYFQYISITLNLAYNINKLYKTFVIHDEKVKPKTPISWERKELLRWNKKHFFMAFSCQILPQTWEYCDHVVNVILNVNPRNFVPFLIVTSLSRFPGIWFYECNPQLSSLTHFMPLISFVIPPVFWCFQGVSKKISGMKWVVQIW